MEIKTKVVNKNKWIFRYIYVSIPWLFLFPLIFSKYLNYKENHLDFIILIGLSLLGIIIFFSIWIFFFKSINKFTWSYDGFILNSKSFKDNISNNDILKLYYGLRPNKIALKTSITIAFDKALVLELTLNRVLVLSLFTIGYEIQHTEKLINKIVERNQTKLVSDKIYYNSKLYGFLNYPKLNQIIQL